MEVVAYAAGLAVVACLIVVVVALCTAAGRADAMAAARNLDGRSSGAPAETGLVDDRTALDARKAASA